MSYSKVKTMWIAIFDVEGIANHWYIAVGLAVDRYFYKYTLEYLEEKVYDKTLEVWSHQWVLKYSIGLSHLLLSVTQVFVLKRNDSNGTPIQFVRSLHVSFLCFQN